VYALCNFSGRFFSLQLGMVNNMLLFHPVAFVSYVFCLVTIGSSVLALELFEILNAAATIKFQLSAFCVTLGIHLRLH
jgi:hypothetical protein